MNYPFSKIVEDIQDSIIVINTEGQIEYANKAFEVISGCQESQVKGQHFSQFIQDEDSWYNNQLYKSRSIQDLILKTIDHETIPVKINHFMEFENENSIKTMFMLRDNSSEVKLKNALETREKEVSAELHNQTKRLKLIQNACNKRNLDTQELCFEFLNIGCSMLNMELGIISRVINDTYEVQFVYDPTSTIQAGASFELENTYCSKVIHNKSTVTYSNVGKEPSMRGHPVYQALNLESYIGVPLYVNKELFGTINFSSKNIREHKFSIHEIELVEILAQTAERALERCFAEQKEKEFTQKLQQLSIIDDLTQVYNRRKLIEDSAAEMQRAKRYKNPLSMLILDIDNFKEINDTQGHIFGDEILKLLASTVHNSIRVVDRLYRYGGEEFVILCSDTNLDQACILAEKLNKIVADKVKLEDTRVTISIGVAELKKEENFEPLFARADQALYEAKNQGKNCFRALK